MQVAPYLDIHTHQAYFSEAITFIKNLRIGVDNTEELPLAHYSAGIHPWDTATIDCIQGLETIKILAQNKKILAIGECGLDKLKGTSLTAQADILLKQLHLAYEHGLPVILHIVKSYNDLLEIIKPLENRPKMLIHGFIGGLELMNQLTQQSFYLSFGKGILNQLPKNIAAFQAISEHQFFLETDVNPTSIEEIYKTAVNLRGVSLEALQNQITQNFKRWTLAGCQEPPF